MKRLNTIERGTHLKVTRGLYTHHGIYVGNGQVVHYSGLANGLNKGKVELTSLSEFMGEATELKYVKYDTTIPTYTQDEICERALKRLNENYYNIILNNCEHFACWCVTGKRESKQVQAVMQLTTTVVILVGATIVKPTVVHAGGSVVSLASASAIAKVASTGTTTSVAVGAQGLVNGATARTITSLGVLGAKALVTSSSTKVAVGSSVIGVSKMMMAAPVVGSTVGLGAVATVSGMATTSAAVGTIGFMAAAPVAVAGAPLVAGALIGAAVFTTGACFIEWLTE